MTDLTTINNQLPSAFEDLARFVLIGRDRMASVRAEISAINRLGLAQEVRQQKLAEAQQISEVVLDAEVKLGELIAAIPKSQGARIDVKLPNSNVRKLMTTKEHALHEIGFNWQSASRLETLAKHPGNYT